MHKRNLIYQPEAIKYRWFVYPLILIFLAGHTAIPVQAQTLVWAKRAGGSADDWVWSIAVLSDGGALVTGKFSGTATFGSGESGETMITSTGYSNIFVARYSNDGTLAWAKRAGGSIGSGGHGIAALSDGSTLVTGSFSGNATFGPSESGETVLTSAGYGDIFLSRYNPDGTCAWAKRAGGSWYDNGSAIAALSDGSAVVTGTFSRTAAFGSGESSQTTLTSAGEFDIFVAKYRPNGTLEWAKRAGGSSPDYCHAVRAGSDGSILVSGNFAGIATFGQGESHETMLASAGEMDIFIARYSPEGTLEWVKRAGGWDDDHAFGISVLLDNCSLVTGVFKESAIFGLGESHEVTLTCEGWYWDTFVAKYNADGALAWANRAGGRLWDRADSIAALSNGGAMITGRFEGTATFGPGEPGETTLTSAGDRDIFLARYNSDGTLAWAKCAGGISDDRGYGIAAFSDNTAVVTGVFSDKATFGPGESEETTLTSAGRYDIFVAKFTGAPPAYAHSYWSLYY